MRTLFLIWQHCKQSKYCLISSSSNGSELCLAGFSFTNQAPKVAPQGEFCLPFKMLPESGSSKHGKPESSLYFSDTLLTFSPALTLLFLDSSTSLKAGKLSRELCYLETSKVKTTPNWGRFQFVLLDWQQRGRTESSPVSQRHLIGANSWQPKERLPNLEVVCCCC